MKTPFFILVLAASVLAGCGDKPQQPAQEPTTSSGNPLNAPTEYLGAAANAQKKAVKTVDVASLNQAIQMFNVQEGHFPKDLKELVDQKYLPKIPEAPYGMQINYDATAGKVTVTAK